MLHRRSLECAAAVLLTALACGAPAPPEPQDARDPKGHLPDEGPALPRLALWVLAEGSERVLEHPEKVPVLVADAQRLGATDLFVQVYRGGRAWFDSSSADTAPYRTAQAAAGADPLARLLGAAGEAGLRVHAWVNVLTLSQNPDAPIVAALGRDAVVTDRRGRSVLDYPGFEVPPPDRQYYRMGTPGVYLDPAHPELAGYLGETFAELVDRYPALAGLHLDYIRYPDVLPYAPGSRFGVGLDFGYGAAARARFRQETGLEAPFGDSIRNANRWDTWRREKVGELVATLAGAARAVRPELLISAAVWSYADRGYLVLGQDWRGWLEAGHLDFAVPMAYTLDDRLLRYQAEAFAGMPYGDRIWVGLGSWLFAKRPERALAQIALVRAAGARSLALFSYDSIVASPALRDALLPPPADAP